MPGKKKGQPRAGQNYMSYALSEQDKALENARITGASPDMARKMGDQAFAQGKADAKASQVYDGLRNVSSMPQPNQAAKSQLFGFRMSVPKTEYDSKGKVKKSLYDYK